MSVRSTRALEQKAHAKPMASCRVRQGSAPTAGNGSGERDISDAERRIGTAATPVAAFSPIRSFGKDAARAQTRKYAAGTQRSKAWFPRAWLLAVARSRSCSV